MPNGKPKGPRIRIHMRIPLPLHQRIEDHARRAGLDRNTWLNKKFEEITAREEGRL